MNDKETIKQYMSKIGSKGGKVSRRTLTKEQAQAMVKKRVAKARIKDKRADQQDN